MQLFAANLLSLEVSKLFSPTFFIMVLLIFLSAFFSMSETAISSISEIKLKKFVEERRAGSKKALNCVENFDRTLTTLLVGNNIVNTLLSVLSVAYFVHLGVTEQYRDLVATGVITLALLIFGEITPKTIGKKYNEKVVLIIAPIIYVLSIVLYPVVFIFRQFQKLVSGKEKTEVQVDEDELETILDTMEEEGAIEENEVTLIKNVFDLNDRTVEDIMVPRIDMIAIDVESSTEEVRELFVKMRYSRIPVYREDKDHIIGILYERDFLYALTSGKKMKSIKEIMKPVKYVNKTLTVDDLIKELQATKVHMAIVSGEYGDTLGLVTMEDALEEIVGEIYDEHDEGTISDKLLVMIDDNSCYVDGEMYVSDMFEELGLGEAPEDTSKISTWVFESIDELPKIGDVIHYISCYTEENEEGQYQDFEKKIAIEIVGLNDRRIEKVKVTVTDATEDEVKDFRDEN